MSRDHLVILDYVFKVLSDVEIEEKKLSDLVLKRRATSEDALNLTFFKLKREILLDLSRDILNLLRCYDEAEAIGDKKGDPLPELPEKEFREKDKF